MKSRAAVAFGPGQPLKIVEIDVAPPKRRSSGQNHPYRRCHTDAFLSGDDPEGVFPAVWVTRRRRGSRVGEGHQPKPGDHVIPHTAEYGECKFCKVR